MDELEDLKRRVSVLETALNEAITALNAVSERHVSLEREFLIVENDVMTDRAVVGAQILASPEPQRLKKLSDMLTSALYANGAAKRARMADRAPELSEALNQSNREHMQFWGDLFNQAVELRKDEE
ncbi:hypothetical protein [Pseudomonas sp. AU12215]|uniref:hypothetical protein n=1 Tax=Pseudomonas sp. AU12215 TaxID=1860123 RepID=UPI0007EE795E|nr:hypothetical protein [Pseudomonas sp. AU12215]OBY58222.1 hypothetical protein A9513_012015 [Pseudomonas sp. AU12215]